uniref:tRNA(His) guanylyltransferase n=1 Tax=Babesia bovis TaxID=5865 RepID=A7AQN8_BABBO|eukprot:XP_001610425.1 tRNA-His guanylyltransferase [Babesia bovis T2Bo]
MANTRFSYVKHFEQDTILLPESWPVVRVDGRGFTKFSKLHEFRKPNEPLALGVMNAAAAHVMSTFDDIVLAYGHSDEYRKILSSVVSAFSSAFSFYWSRFYPDRQLKILPSFDGRIVLYPRFENIVDYFSWRHADCHINNQYNICFWCLVADGKCPDEAYKWLKHTQKGEKNEYIYQSRGINYNNLPRIFRKGTTLVRLLSTEPGLGQCVQDGITTKVDRGSIDCQATDRHRLDTSIVNTRQQATGDVIELTIDESEIALISQKLDSICNPMGIGVVHCDNTSEAFWNAAAPSYSMDGGTRTKKNIDTIAALSTDMINKLNSGR